MSKVKFGTMMISHTALFQGFTLIKAGYEGLIFMIEAICFMLIVCQIK